MLKDALMPYDLKSLKVPKLSGNSLRATVNLLENSYSRRLLEFPIIKEAGLDRLRKLNIQEAPCYTPKHPLARAPAPEKARASLDEIGRASGRASGAGAQ